MSRRYIVGIREVHVSFRDVEFEGDEDVSRDEILEEAPNADELWMEYSHTLDKQEHATVEEVPLDWDLKQPLPQSDQHAADQHRAGDEQVLCVYRLPEDIASDWPDQHGYAFVSAAEWTEGDRIAREQCWEHAKEAGLLNEETDTKETVMANLSLVFAVRFRGPLPPYEAFLDPTDYALQRADGKDS